VGTVNYGSQLRSPDQYDRFKQYLGEKLQAVIQLEPAFNERKAIERIQSQEWSLVFAPPGLAVIAMTKHQYTPLFPLIGVNNLRSVLVVQKDSPAQDLKSLSGKRIAIGQPGSATGYYFPIFNLYGLTLAELIVSPTPKAVLEAIAQGKADAGALSLEEFNTLKPQLSPVEFRVLFNDPHAVPPGVLLISPIVDRTLQESIQKILSEAPSVVAEEVGFVPSGSTPDYKYMISVVERVRSIFPADQVEGAGLLSQKPVRLFKSGETTTVEASGSPTTAATPQPTETSTPTPTP
jgi:phosphonate transport system substrate-binding protein